MRALAILVLLAGVARADGPRQQPIGFDHVIHARDVDVAGGAAIPCARCHVVQRGKLIGRPGHADCFGACHGAAPKAPRRGERFALDEERAKLCTNCHAEAALVAPYTGALTVPYPPYAIEADFNLAFGHARHVRTTCTACHDPDRTPGKHGTPHARCAGCHDGTAGRGAAMTACEGCHTAAVGKPQPPELAVVHDNVTAEFSHRLHAARGGAGKDCATCHAAIRKTDDSELPRPTANDCATSGCHDGHAAFGVTTACTRCHVKAPPQFTVARPTARFVHGGHHADALATRPCAACHPLDPGGEILVAGHAACASCHAADFGARRPTICGACHEATEPWRPLTPDRELPARSEFGATLDHAKHPGACTGCHSLETRATQLRPPRGHGACDKAGCHAVTGGPAPRLGDCNGCHRAGLAVARAARRAADPWSVRAAFDHAPHAAAACTSCHVDLAGANVLDLPAPPKSTCAPCHDGTTSFKLTGTACTRCHVGTKR